MEIKKNLLVPSALMAVIPLLLYFAPVVSGIAGGIVGGARAGSPKRALIAAIIPSLVVGLGLWILLRVVNAPVFGITNNSAAAMIIPVTSLAIYIGALIGGAVAHNRRNELGGRMVRG